MRDCQGPEPASDRPLRRPVPAAGFPAAARRPAGGIAAPGVARAAGGAGEPRRAGRERDIFNNRSGLTASPNSWGDASSHARDIHTAVNFPVTMNRPELNRPELRLLLGRALSCRDPSSLGWRSAGLSVLTTIGCSIGQPEVVVYSALDREFAEPGASAFSGGKRNGRAREIRR